MIVGAVGNEVCFYTTVWGLTGSRVAGLLGSIPVGDALPASMLNGRVYSLRVEDAVFSASS